MSANISLLERLKSEMDAALKGGIYHLTQIKLCYNSNRIEGSKLSEDQTRYIYETNTVDTEGNVLNVDDIVETVNHFSAFRYLLKTAEEALSEDIIKEYHRILKTGTRDAQKDWFKIGEYKKAVNIVGDMETTPPNAVPEEMQKLLINYHGKTLHTVSDIICFHHDFECIHPFQDGNGRVGRLIMFKECLKNNITPFIIADEHKIYYYRGLKEYKRTPEYLTETCMAAQKIYSEHLKYFGIETWLLL